MQLGRVYDAACELLMEEQPAIGEEDVIIPIVAECDDSFLSENRRMQVQPGDVREALAAARASAGAPGIPRTAEGAVGAGTGMSCLGYKGGIGTASRVVPGGATVGVVTMTNFGDRERLTVAGVPAGRLLPDPAAGAGPAGTAGGEGAAGRVPRPGPAGSCIVVILTDGPLDAAACQRLARRAGLGLARVGSTAHHASGEIFLALATGLRAPRGQAPGPVPGDRQRAGRLLRGRGRGHRGGRAEQPAAGGDRDRPGGPYLLRAARRRAARLVAERTAGPA